MQKILKSLPKVAPKAPQSRNSAAFFALKEKSLFTLLNRLMPHMPHIFRILTYRDAEIPLFSIGKSWVTPKYAAFAASH